ncbi:MAG: AAA-like domain-containing protein [Cyanobacteria bacterium J06649_5]
MTEKEALEAVRNAIAPDSLSYVQEIVFTQSWAGQLYPEIAKSVGYHPEYIRDVGAQLWRSLSESLDQKVTKKNVRFVLNSLSEKNQLPGSNTSSLLSVSSSETSVQGITSGSDTPPSHRSHDLQSQVDTVLSTEATTTQLAFPSVGLSIKSAFYVPRPPAEEQAFHELDRPGGLLRIKAPSNTGKTSLLLRALEYARSQGARTVLLNIQEADTAVLDDLGRFLRWFCRNVAQQLGLENKLDDYWDEEIGLKVSCKIYFREYLLTQVSDPIVLALDEVDQLFEHPTLVQEFLPMLRVWHEEAMELEVWQKLRLVLSYNSEVYVPLKISQSPFNIGLSIQLPVLTIKQVIALAEQYKLDLSDSLQSEQLSRLHQLVAGHPYLVQLALYWLSERDITLTSILENAHTQSGIYSHHLRRHWQIMQRQPHLQEAFAEVLKAPEDGAEVDTLMAYQLERMGLVYLQGNRAIVSSKLYYRHFKARLLS